MIAYVLKIFLILLSFFLFLVIFIYLIFYCKFQFLDIWPIFYVSFLLLLFYNLYSPLIFDYLHLSNFFPHILYFCFLFILLVGHINLSSNIYQDSHLIMLSSSCLQPSYSSFYLLLFFLFVSHLRRGYYHNHRISYKDLIFISSNYSSTHVLRCFLPVVSKWRAHERNFRQIIRYNIQPTYIPTNQPYFQQNWRPF